MIVPASPAPPLELRPFLARPPEYLRSIDECDTQVHQVFALLNTAMREGDQHPVEKGFSELDELYDVVDMFSESTVRAAWRGKFLLGAVATCKNLRIAPSGNDITLEALAVSSRERNHGIGGALLQTVLQQSAAEGVSVMRLTAHPRVVGWYERQGARRTGTAAYGYYTCLQFDL